MIELLLDLELNGSDPWVIVIMVREIRIIHINWRVMSPKSLLLTSHRWMDILHQQRTVTCLLNTILTYTYRQLMETMTFNSLRHEYLRTSSRTQTTVKVSDIWILLRQEFWILKQHLVPCNRDKIIRITRTHHSCGQGFLRHLYFYPWSFFYTEVLT